MYLVGSKTLVRSNKFILSPDWRLPFCMLLSVSRHRTIMGIFEKEPRINKDVFVAPSAAVIGDVEIGHGSSIWYGSILRGKLLDWVNHGCYLVDYTLFPVRINGF